MKFFSARLFTGLSLAAVLLTTSISAFAAAPNLTLTGSVDAKGMIQLKWNPVASNAKVEAGADSKSIQGYAVFLRKASDTDTSWNKKPFARLKLSDNNYTYYNLENMPSATYVAQVAAYDYSTVGYHFDYYTNEVTVQVGSTVNPSSSLALSTQPQTMIVTNKVGTTTSLALTGEVKDCMMKFKWSTLSDSVRLEGYAIFLKNVNDTDDTWFKKPFGLLEKTLGNHTYYNLSGMPYGTYIAKVATYDYDITGYQFDTYSNEVKVDYNCGTAPAAVAESLSAPTITAPYAQQYFTDYPRIATIKWTSVSGAASYQIAIECDICGSSLWESKYPLYSTTGTSFVTSPLAGNNIFRVRVRAVGNSSVGPWSDYRVFSYTTSTLDEQVKFLAQTLTQPKSEKPMQPEKSERSQSSNSSKSAVSNQDLYLTASVVKGGVSLNFGYQDDEVQEASLYQQFVIERYTLTKKNLRVGSSKQIFLVDPDEDTYVDMNVVFGKKYSYRVYAVVYLANGKTKNIGSSSIVKLLYK